MNEAPGCFAAIFHPFRWIRLFFQAMLYGPDYSVYDVMAKEFNVKQGYGGEDQADGQAEGLGVGRGYRSGSRHGPRLLDDTDGFSDKDDESYYGMT